MSHRYLTDGGDGLTLALPAYLRVRSWWEPNIMLGYPWAANFDGYWDPLAILLRTVPHTFNIYMLAAFIIAACGTYALVHELTGSSLGSTVAGIAYALGGFMISHLGHYDIVHPAAWAPWAVCAFAALRRRTTASWITAGAAAIALTMLSGQPQVALYTLAMCAALVITACLWLQSGWRYFRASAMTVTAGIGLAAITLLPGAELARASIRARLPFDTFVSYSNPPNEIPIRLLFPYFLGQTQNHLYPFSATGADSWTELSNYAGVITLILAAVACISRFREPMVRLWSAIGVVALVLSAGNGFKAAQITYLLPAFNLFRAQGRHAFEFTLCAAVLAGFGVAAIEQHQVSRRQIKAAMGVIGAFALSVLCAIGYLDGPFAAQQMLTSGGTPFPIDPFHNPALAIPLCVYLCAASSVFWFSQQPAALPARWTLLAVTIVDLASFAWFGQWRDAHVTPAQLAPPKLLATLSRALAGSHERVMTIPNGGNDPSVADLNVLWNLPITGGRVSLAVARTAALFEMDQDGLISPHLFDDARACALDLGAIRYILLPAGSQGIRPAKAPFDSADLNVHIGSRVWTSTAWVPSASYATHFSGPVRASSVFLVSSLSDSSTIPDRSRVADLVLTTPQHRIDIPILAGRDTAERGYDRPEMRSVTRHTRAHIFSSTGIDHEYLATFAFGKRETISSVALVWSSVFATHGYLHLAKLSLLDNFTNRAFTLAPLTFLQGAPRHWAQVTSAAHEGVLLRNLQPLGRAWVVHTVITTSPADALAHIRSGALNPRTTALAEGFSGLRTRAGPGESVRVVSSRGGLMTLDVRCITTCFVVTSDAGDPGWTAQVDGSSTPVYQTDFALRGAVVGAGRHQLTFVYRATSMIAGTMITMATALLLIALLVQGRRTCSSDVTPVDHRRSHAHW